MGEKWGSSGFKEVKHDRGLGGVSGASRVCLLALRELGLCPPSHRDGGDRPAPLGLRFQGTTSGP